MSSETTPKCADCVFYKMINQTKGWCRFNPPVISYIDSESKQPETLGTNFCSRHMLQTETQVTEGISTITKYAYEFTFEIGFEIAL